MSTDENPAKPFNLNTAAILVSFLITVVGGIVTTGTFLLPLKTLPEDMREVKKEVSGMQIIQEVQTDALQRLAKIAEDGATTRRDVDKLSTEIGEVKRRLDRIEKN